MVVCTWKLYYNLVLFRNRSETESLEVGRLQLGGIVITRPTHRLFLVISRLMVSLVIIGIIEQSAYELFSHIS